jgi:hypothetical protein
VVAVVARSSPGVASSVRVELKFADDDAEKASFGVQQRSKPNWQWRHGVLRVELRGLLVRGQPNETWLQSRCCSCWPREEDGRGGGSRWELLLVGGASSWYTASEVRLGFSECFSAVRSKGTADVAVPRCSTRGQEAAQRSTNLGRHPDRVQVLARAGWQRDSSKVSVAVAVAVAGG